MNYAYKKWHLAFLAKDEILHEWKDDGKKKTHEPKS